MRGRGSSAMAGTQAYGEAWYWDKRYSKQEGGHDPAAFPFDWYQKYPSLAPLFHLYIPPKSRSNHYHRFLLVGCGNSAFSEDMVKDGYCDIYNIDISSVVIQAMQRKYSTWPQMKFMKMDVRDMSAFEEGSFDAVVDKGTLDSILCGQDSQENATKMLEEVGS